MVDAFAESKKQMAKQKAPNARRVIVFVETLHATSHTYVEAARKLQQRSSW
jgi:hypothetical protein